LEILYLDEVDSTQTFLIENLKSGTLQAPILVTAKKQTAGIGSRGNFWLDSGESFYISFALLKDSLPMDLEIQSASIYFGVLLKEILVKNHSNAYLKWPNDIYLYDKKI